MMDPKYTTSGTNPRVQMHFPDAIHQTHLASMLYVLCSGLYLLRPYLCIPLDFQCLRKGVAGWLFILTNDHFCDFSHWSNFRVIYNGDFIVRAQELYAAQLCVFRNEPATNFLFHRYRDCKLWIMVLNLCECKQIFFSFCIYDTISIHSRILSY